MPSRDISKLLSFILVLGLSGCAEHPSEPKDIGQNEPPLQIEWVDVTFEEAGQLAIAQEKQLLVYAMASWCGWCRKLSETTWADPAVIEWINENTIAFKWDVDDPKLAGLLPDVRGIPTVVVLESGTEIDRQVGYMASEEYLAWFESIGTREVGSPAEPA